MRQKYRTHGKHCYLRSFPTECPRCGEKVLYWECRHGSKVFFKYPPYGKLIRHRCKKIKGKQKKNYPVIVKTPKGLLGEEFPSCPACGKVFKNASDLENHIDNLQKIDPLHKSYANSKIVFRKPKDKREDPYMPKFGSINIKKKED